MQGNVKAEASLGALYYKGFGVPKSYSNAFFWLKRAADQGDYIAKKFIEKIKRRQIAK